MSLFVIILTLPLTAVEGAADDESDGDGDEVLDHELAFGSQEEGVEALGGNVGFDHQYKEDAYRLSVPR